MGGRTGEFRFGNTHAICAEGQFRIVRIDHLGEQPSRHGTIHADMAPALRGKIEKAFMDLSPSTPEGKEILDLARATRFIPTKAENYKGMERAARSADLIK